MRRRKLIKSRFYRYTSKHAETFIEKIIEAQTEEAKQTTHFTPEAVVQFIQKQGGKMR